MQRAVERLSFEQLINEANMLDFLNINDSKCPLMEMCMHVLTDALNNFSLTEILKNKELINELNQSLSEHLSQKIISNLKIAILKQHGIGKENILPATIKLKTRIAQIAFSYDGKYVALTYGDPDVVPLDTVFVFNVETGKELAALPHQGQIHSICLSDNHQRIAIVNDNNVIVFDTIKYTQLDSFSHSAATRDALFGPDNETIFSFSRNNQNNIIVWKWNADGSKYTQEQSLTDPHGQVDMIDISKDGRCFISGSRSDKSITLWNASDYKIEGQLTAYHNVKAIDLLKLSPDSTKIIAVHRDHTMILWDVKKQSIQHVFSKEEVIGFATFSPDSSVIASGSFKFKKGIIALWNASTGEKMCEFDSQYQFIDSLYFVNNGNTLAVKAGNLTTATLLMIDLFTKKQQEFLKKLETISLFDQIITASDYKETLKSAQKSSPY